MNEDEEGPVSKESVLECPIVREIDVGWQELEELRDLLVDTESLELFDRDFGIPFHLESAS